MRIDGTVGAVIHLVREDYLVGACMYFEAKRLEAKRTRRK